MCVCKCVSVGVSVKCQLQVANCNNFCDFSDFFLLLERVAGGQTRKEEKKEDSCEKKKNEMDGKDSGKTLQHFAGATQGTLSLSVSVPRNIVAFVF